MPFVRVAQDLEMHYLVDDFTDPWCKPETVLLLHGGSESSAVWFGWVPHLARHFQVVRPDMRGFGASTPMARDYAWDMDRILDDFIALMRSLKVERFHLVGAKLGGNFARCLAARHPQLVRTLTVVGSPPPLRLLHGRAERIDGIEKKGSEAWARETMAGRLGDGFPQAGFEWWVKLMSRTPVSTQIGFMPTIPALDISADLPRIQCPTLVITTVDSALGSVEKTREWQQKIPRSRLLVLPGNSYHVAASDADECARKTLDFILQEEAAGA